jgi:antitoxin ParD1/3/4
MVITIDLPAEVEAQLRDSASRGDSETVRRLLVEALTPTVEALLAESRQELTEGEFERLADQLADEFEGCFEGDVPVLSDQAINREGIYGEHP